MNKHKLFAMQTFLIRAFVVKHFMKCPNRQKEEVI